MKEELSLNIPVTSKHRIYPEINILYQLKLPTIIPYGSLLKQSPRTNHKPEMLEKSKMMITQVKSMLVSELTSETTGNVEDIVDFSNDVFNTLNWLGANYDCFYRDVKELISNKYELQIEERKGMTKLASISLLIRHPKKCCFNLFSFLFSSATPSI